MRSMTGFGRGVVATDEMRATVDVRAVNHRFLDLHFRLPLGTDSLEMQLRRLLKENVARGHLEVSLSLDRSAARTKPIGSVCSRHREEGKTGLVDRTSRPRRFRRPVPQARIHQIISLRQRRLTGWQIARTLRSSAAEGGVEAHGPTVATQRPAPPVPPAAAVTQRRLSAIEQLTPDLATPQPAQ